jgi:hypothetical protein
MTERVNMLLRSFYITDKSISSLFLKHILYFPSLVYSDIGHVVHS